MRAIGVYRRIRLAHESYLGESALDKRERKGTSERAILPRLFSYGVAQTIIPTIRSRAIRYVLFPRLRGWP